MKIRFKISAILLPMALAGVALAAGGVGKAGLLQKVRESTEPYEPSTIPFEHWTVNVRTGDEFVDVSGKTFHVERRIPAMMQYPCDNCHGSGAVRRIVAERSTEQGSIKLSHWQIDLKHGSAVNMTCQSCHNPDDQFSLRTINGDPVSFDTSFVLCRSCHGKEGSDWAAGAHGKRLGNWGGPRIIRSCTGCHNPHEPSMPRRRPTTNAVMPTEWSK